MPRKPTLPAYATGPSVRRRTLPFSRASRPPVELGRDDFSYASPDDPWPKRVAIRTIERLTGQPRLHAMYMDYLSLPEPRESFWAAATEYLNLHLVYDEDRLNQIPTGRAHVVVANHPFGVVDGVVSGHLVSRVRPDFKIITNSALYRAPEARPNLLPIDFNETQEALETNLATRRAAKEHLKNDGCVVIFPAGGVSTSPSAFAKRAIESDWKVFVGQLVHTGRASVTPFFFDGQNSRPFQIASHVSQTLRMALFFHEVRRQMGSTIQINIGAPIPFDELAALGDRRRITEHLQSATIALRRNTANGA